MKAYSDSVGSKVFFYDQFDLIRLIQLTGLHIDQDLFIMARYTIISLLFLVMGVFSVIYDPNITNGTCFYSAGKQLGNTFSPAGNSALGHTFCCQLGDKLNPHHACVTTTDEGKSELSFDSDLLTLTGIYTYLAGCTDETYQSKSCPFKGNYTDYPWIGLVKCDNNDNSEASSWVGCDNDKSDTIQPSEKSQSCSCNLSGDDADQELFHAGNLDAWGVLPKSKFGQIKWESGYPPASKTSWKTNTPPSSTVVPTSTSTSSNTNTITSHTTFSQSTVISTATINPPAATSIVPAPLKEGEWSSGKKTGFGLGVGFGALALLLIATYLIYRFTSSKFYNGPGANGRANIRKRDYPPIELHSIYTGPQSAYGSPRTWSGYVNELPNNEVHPGSLIAGTHSIHRRYSGQYQPTAREPAPRPEIPTSPLLPPTPTAYFGNSVSRIVPLNDENILQRPRSVSPMPFYLEEHLRDEPVDSRLASAPRNSSAFPQEEWDPAFPAPLARGRSLRNHSEFYRVKRRSQAEVLEETPNEDRPRWARTGQSPAGVTFLPGRGSVTSRDWRRGADLLGGLAGQEGTENAVLPDWAGR